MPLPLSRSRYYRSRGGVTITVDGSGFQHISTAQMVFSVVLTYNVTFSDGTTELDPVTREFEGVSVGKILYTGA